MRHALCSSPSKKGAGQLNDVGLETYNGDAIYDVREVNERADMRTQGRSTSRILSERGPSERSVHARARRRTQRDRRPSAATASRLFPF